MTPEHGGIARAGLTGAFEAAYLRFIEPGSTGFQERLAMSVFSRTFDFFRLLASAQRIAAAVEAHTSPRARDLERLGIGAAAFGAIGRA